MTITRHGFRTVLLVALLVLSAAVAGPATAADAGAQASADEAVSAERTSQSALGAAQATSEANFTRQSYTDQRGDVVNITVDVADADRAVLTVGGDGVGYTANVSVDDGDGDGRVTVLWNTFAAASTEQIPLDAQAGTVFETAAEADNLSVTSVDTGVAGGPESELLAAAEYPLTVRGGTGPPDFAVADLQARSTESLDVWTAPGDPDGEIDNETTVYRRIDEGTLTEAESIAIGDRAVFRIRASGLSGALAAQNGSTTAERFGNLTESGLTDFSVERTESGLNRPTAVWNLSDEALTGVVADSANDTYFLVVDTGRINATAADGGNGSVEVRDGDRWAANFAVREGALTNETQTVSAAFATVEPSIEFAEEPINVTASDDATVSGSASMAPGTELSVRVRSTGDTRPRFLLTQTTTVGPDGRWNVTLDLGDQRAGDTFEVTVSGESVEATADGNVVEGE